MKNQVIEDKLNKIFAKPKTYLFLAAVFIISVVVSLWLPLDDLFKGIASTPAIGALLAVVYQLLRDHAAYEKQLELQKKQQFFNLGITSHMAEIAFDKHVEFCEKYMTEVRETLSIFIQQGPTEKGMEQGQKLSSIRMEYDTWITEDIFSSLIDFEEAVFRVGSMTRLSERTSQPDTSEKASKEADELWDEILGNLLDKNKTPNNNIAIECVKKKIRDILGIEKLTKLRSKLMNKAIESLG